VPVQKRLSSKRRTTEPRQSPEESSFEGCGATQKRVSDKGRQTDRVVFCRLPRAVTED
jgi:hypothetical protein